MQAQGGTCHSVKAFQERFVRRAVGNRRAGLASAIWSWVRAETAAMQSSGASLWSKARAVKERIADKACTSPGSLWAFRVSCKSRISVRQLPQQATRRSELAGFKDERLAHKLRLCSAVCDTDGKSSQIRRSTRNRETPYPAPLSASGVLCTCLMTCNEGGREGWDGMGWEIPSAQHVQAWMEELDMCVCGGGGGGDYTDLEGPQFLEVCHAARSKVDIGWLQGRRVHSVQAGQLEGQHTQGPQRQGVISIGKLQGKHTALQSMLSAHSSLSLDFPHQAKD